MSSMPGVFMSLFPITDRIAWKKNQVKDAFNAHVCAVFLWPLFKIKRPTANSPELFDKNLVFDNNS